MVPNHSLKLGLGITAFVCLAGCGTNYTVTGHAQSAAFARPSCRIVVEPLHADALTVDGKSEGSYLAGKKDKGVQSYANDKVVSERTFREELMAKHGATFTNRANDNTFTIRPTWTAWDPGYFAGIFGKAGTVRLSLHVIGPDGQSADRVSIEAQSSKDYSSGSRMRQALGNAGEGLREYISENWQCAR